MRTPRFPLALLTAGLAVAPAVWTARPALAADEAPKAPAEKPADKPTEKPTEKPAGERPERPAAGRLDPSAIVERVRAATDKLSLSAEQKAKVDEALAKAKTSLADAGKGGREGLMKALGDLRESLNGALTEEQRAKLAEAVPLLNRFGGGGAGAGNERPGRRPGAAPGDGAAAGAPGERLAGMARAATAALEKLDVPAELKAKVKALNEEYDGKVRKLVAELKDNREGLAEKLRPMMEERRQKMAEILSPEQLQKFQQLVREQAEALRGGGDRPAPKPEAKPEVKPDAKPEVKPEGEKKKD